MKQAIHKLPDSEFSFEDVLKQRVHDGQPLLVSTENNSPAVLNQVNQKIDAFVADFNVKTSSSLRVKRLGTHTKS